MGKRVGDLEIEQDLEFQRREWAVQRIAWWVLSGFIAAALLGVFGGGPLSRGQAGDRDGPIWVEYERFVRSGTSTRMSVHLGAASAEGTRELRLNRPYFDSLRVAHVIPEPASVVIGRHEVIFLFTDQKASNDSTVILELTSIDPGWHSIRIGTGQQAGLGFRQLAYF